MKFKWKGITMLALALPFMGLSQSEQEISLDEVKSKVLSHNPALKAAEMQTEVAEAVVRETRSLFLPHLSASWSAVTGDVPLMVFGSKINQGIVKEADFQPALLNSPDRISNFQTGVELRQPIVQSEGWARRDAAKKMSSAAGYEFQNSREGMVHAAEMLYLQLQFLYRQKEHLGETLGLVKRNRDFVSQQYEEGLAQRADLLDVELRVLEIEDQLLSVTEGIGKVSDHLNQIMGAEPGEVFKPVDELELWEIEDPKGRDLNISRSDLAALEMNIRAMDDMETAESRRLMPQVNGFASYEWNNSDFYPSGSGGYMVGISLNWNLFDGGIRAARMQKASAKRQAASWDFEHRVSMSKKEILATTRNISLLKNRLELVGAALEQAEEALRLRLDRFEEGLERVPDLIKAELQFTERTMERSSLVFEYNQNALELKFLTR
ncbi:MAG: TolC family protein [Saprospirales bacterium]|nr:MAG: TolC family protein [Saprospirales bacterium]